MASAISMRERRHLLPQLGDRTLRISEQTVRLGQRRRRTFVLRAVEHVQNDADEKRLRRLLPVRFESLAVGIDDQRREILNVRDLVLGAEPDFFERVPADRSGGRSRLEPQHSVSRTGATPACRQTPELAFEVGNEGAMRPRQQRRHDETDTFAGAGGRVAENVFGPAVP
jgi:hypothetical protein